MDLPLGYRWLVAHGFKGFAPWYLIDPKDSEDIRHEYHLETGNDMIPFARRQDNDDVAGFDLSDSEVTSKIISVHLTWKSKQESNGFPLTRESRDIFDWLTTIVIPATQQWMSEGELSDIEIE